MKPRFVPEPQEAADGLFYVAGAEIYANFKPWAWSDGGIQSPIGPPRFCQVRQSRAKATHTPVDRVAPMATLLRPRMQPPPSTATARRARPFVSTSDVGASFRRSG
jgi:hypothetical protein